MFGDVKGSQSRRRFLLRNSIRADASLVVEMVGIPFIDCPSRSFFPRKGANKGTGDEASSSRGPADGANQGSSQNFDRPAGGEDPAAQQNNTEQSSGGEGNTDQANPEQQHRANVDRNVDIANPPYRGRESSTTSFWDKLISKKPVFSLSKGIFYNTGGTRLKAMLVTAFSYDNDSTNTFRGLSLSVSFKVNCEIGASPIEPELPQGRVVFTEFRGGLNQKMVRYEVGTVFPRAIDSNLLNHDLSMAKVDTALALIGKEHRYNILGFATPLNIFKSFLPKYINFWWTCYSPNPVIPLKWYNPNNWTWSVQQTTFLTENHFLGNGVRFAVKLDHEIVGSRVREKILFLKLLIN